MLPNAAGFSSIHVLAMVASLAVSFTGAGQPSGHADPAIRRAQELLDTVIIVPIDVVDVRKLPTSLADVVKGTCAYTHKGVRRIYVTSSCPVYRAARESLFDAMKLAAILHHELAHLESADEARAYKVEASAFRALVGRGPTRFVSQGLAYAHDLDRRADAAGVRDRITANASRGSGQTVHVIAAPPPLRH